MKAPSPPLYLRPVDSKFDNGPRKCTMLTAREMEELVHGKDSADSKLSQVGVTSKKFANVLNRENCLRPEALNLHVENNELNYYDNLDPSLLRSRWFQDIRIRLFQLLATDLSDVTRP
ncbi:hypothetical protein CEXT_354541 [Caerostris extrusa]|uniref:Uncharacterized protein n=1 Tax=Caerostris extrusa TaxID=172846 RepID=A0AAV4RD16_CAEEX|nr:hypothetical protein CEXT_354541 [Caerostris extrusa]